ncbi:low molecular weight protein-tyrosine-phosphatase [Myroides sp. WP-1]|uniref:low molecular weight protein-tyrosine-phosphatase n=1 Tax=Myroides sp. WP-1 TaxID=2759944 RepID=UPI0015FDF0AF|nr:low molecular weight protein-tyrosine-phosphatase [Myroides sp. WP-1]MBB1139717.1 low molecular weight phosphotyrosine protein phosphatase [Myroides sp. WP-1]
MKVKVLMVCLGNICRSPLAEGILQAKLPQENFLVDSAGTGNWHVGEQPDSRSIEVAKKYGIDLTTQRARQFKKSDFSTFDHIFVMDQSNYNNVIQLAETAEDKAKVRLLLEVLDATKKAEVPDPYYGGPDGFEHVYQLIDQACTLIASDLKS